MSPSHQPGSYIPSCFKAKWVLTHSSRVASKRGLGVCGNPVGQGIEVFLPDIKENAK